jgi:hypothetical protein
MTAAKLKKFEASLQPCRCGGQLYISSIRGSFTKGKKNGLVHLAVRCRQCGAWRGGFTCKDTPDIK